MGSRAGATDQRASLRRLQLPPRKLAAAAHHVQRTEQELRLSAQLMFEIVARDELWILGPHLALREQRLSHGQATLSGLELMADDSLPSDLLPVCDRELRTVIESLPQMEVMMMARVVVTVRRAAADLIAETTIALSSGKHSLIT